MTMGNSPSVCRRSGYKGLKLHAEQNNRDMESPNSSFDSRILCHCGDRADFRTSQTSENPGRVFVACPNYKISSCGFFRWIDNEKSLDRKKPVEIEYRDLSVKIMELDKKIDEFEKKFDKFEKKFDKFEKKIAKKVDEWETKFKFFLFPFQLYCGCNSSNFYF